MIGAGPYGLAVANHLRGVGSDVRIFGKVMDFWANHMPIGMWLRSPRTGSDIADPERRLTLDQYETVQKREPTRLISLDYFISYGRWYQAQALPDLDPRLVARITRNHAGFALDLEDGERFHCQKVVLAAGIGSFAHCPEPFQALPQDLVSHTSAAVNRDLGRFANKRVIVVGGGQSAIESAALLHESGVQVEVLVRRPMLRWLKSDSTLEWLYDKFSPFRAPGKIGPLFLNWLVEHPRLFTSFPRKLQDRMTARAIRPAASGWLRPRMTKVPITCGQRIVTAREHHGKVHLQTEDGAEYQADHVLLGTGYRIAISRYSFLEPRLLDSIKTHNGYPVLSHSFESSAPGLYFVGATAVHSFGPLCRFVIGTKFTAQTLAKYAAKSPHRRPVKTQVLAGKGPSPDSGQ